MSIKLYCDDANPTNCLHLEHFKIDGYTTNPTLINNYIQSNNKTFDYEKYIKWYISKSSNLPTSFEVLSDSHEIIINEAVNIQNIHTSIYIKIPITLPNGECNLQIINKLLTDGIKINITAVFTYEQLDNIKRYISDTSTDCIISIFCGRINDTCKSAIDICKHASTLFSNNKKIKILWASAREVYNLQNAIDAGCDIITMSPDLILKMDKLFNYNLNEYSLSTIKDFYKDISKLKKNLISNDCSM